MTRATLTAAAVALAGGGACGSSSTNPNDSVVARAKGSEATVSQVQAKLASALQLHEYAGVENAFTVPIGSPDVYMGDSGTECSLDIYAGREAQFHAGDSSLKSPDGQIVVDVGVFQGGWQSECLQAVRTATGW